DIPDSLHMLPIDEDYATTILTRSSLLEAVEDVLDEARLAVYAEAYQAALKSGEYGQSVFTLVEEDVQAVLTQVEEEMIWQLGSLEDLVQNYGKPMPAGH